MRVVRAKKPEVKCTCQHCKSTLAVHKDDIKSHTRYDYGGDRVYTAECPVCKTRFTIPEQTIPYGWRG